MTNLIEAVKNGDLEKVKELIKYGADIQYWGKKPFLNANFYI